MSVEREASRFLRGLHGLSVADPRWQQARAYLVDAMSADRLDLLEALWPRLAAAGLHTLAQQAWRGRLHCGSDGARAFLASLEVTPQFERAWRQDRTGDQAGLLGHALGQAQLAELISAARPGSRGASVLALAVQERVLRDGEVDQPQLVAWWTDHARSGPALRTHEWERGMLAPVVSQNETAGNIYSAGRRLDWPRGIPAEAGDAAPHRVVRSWGHDDEHDPDWPPGQPPPAGPFVDTELYPNASTWCFEAAGVDGGCERLCRWPFRPDSVAVAHLDAQPVAVEQLVQQWIWRGLVAGAYGVNRGAARARQHAWRSLSALAGLPPDTPIEQIAAAASELEVWGFRPVGPLVEALGGDFGWVARAPDGRAWAAAHSDTD